MGSGIAQVAAQSGFNTLLFDVNAAALEKAKASIEQQLSALQQKQRITGEEKARILSSIRFITDSSDCIGDIIIEAIIEKPEAKAALFNQLAACNSTDTIFATNTSSLSVTAIAAATVNPSRVAGMHFFNPAPVMKLVEIVQAGQTANDTISVLHALATQMGKTPVVCKDVPGFIVNRVARHYYLEALHLVEQGVADVETVDRIMEATGFKLGPFRLMDLIGNDINLAVTESLYRAFNQPLRFRPALLQQQKVWQGYLGRKTGNGYYS